MIHQELYLASPWMNAAGTLGYALPARWPVPGVDLGSFGAFVTNPISFTQRTPAAGRGLVLCPGAALLHSGLPNPGLKQVLKKYAERWAQSRLPVWVHLFGSNPEEIQQMIRRLEGREGVMAVELGLPPDAPAEEALALARAAYGELPLIIHLPFNRANEPWVRELPRLGASAISLGAPRGTLPGPDGKFVSGRLYGPGLFPLMLAAIQSLRGLAIPLIAAAGIYCSADARAMLSAGARAVQLDTVLWRGWSGS